MSKEIETMSLDQFKEAVSESAIERMTIAGEIRQVLRDLLICAEMGRIPDATEIRAGRDLLARADANFDAAMHLSMSVRIV